ncbi:hypothetical protein HYG87_10520 [Methanobacterium alkalithermotolerans]|uniref:Uncharacterized protein n=1 Tax=Methanobacterium alkalithermotolerans TaxID=2731220 RepID=A0A8T8K8C4_9EURY|nr:hypothetical protein [Methanobacterium alkalithermotolerans]QUH24159.1 hypothetical protein HYG87_10520 [Methanobacterium alkalithermotolerans]
MDEKDIQDFVDNFKGMTWDDLEDVLAVMTREDMVLAIHKLKKRFG